MPDAAPRLEFHFPDADGRADSLCFADPDAVIVAETLADVRPALIAVQNAVNRGCYAAGFVAYEAAPAFDPALIVREGGTLPLVWFGLFQNPVAVPPNDESGAFHLTPWQPSLTRDAYHAPIAALRDAIAAGDSYQVNYTLRLRAEFSGDPGAFFTPLRRAQTPCYAADIALGRFRILSASPELFFRRSENKLITRPMKGTRKRGRWPEEDANLAHDLQISPKDRAENVMIVDLLRSDLGKIAVPGTVHVADLFQIERYPTVWQMTSTIDAQLNANTTLDDIFAALFPCGSVTGAPKVAAMRQIAELEDTPRGVYCGAIGFIRPNSAAVFSVAIRTLTLDTQEHTAEYGIGGGIVWDSTADGEYDEALSKANVLTAETPDFSLLETMRLGYGSYFLRERHLDRVTASAHFFGIPINRADIDAALDAIAAAFPTGVRRVRLTLDNAGQFHIEHAKSRRLPPGPLTVVLADSPIDSRDCFLFHKTTHRTVYNHHKAAHPDAFDVLLYNERGELTEFTIGNLVIERDGELFTPPIECGLLPGTMRAEWIDQGKIKERVLTREDLTDPTGKTKLWLINSVRGWVPVFYAAGVVGKVRTYHRDHDKYMVTPKENNMADDTLVTNTAAADAAAVDADTNKEPATRHDVAEGAGIGVVGGAIVGGLAGGPVGAVIGAVAGGVASAGAVDVVDKHDNDYERTMANHSTAPMSADSGAVSDDDSAYRSHYNSNYAATGASYDEYDPAYRHGSTLAAHPDYQNSDWNAVESNVRNDWETRQPGTWDRFKGSVRHGWDRAKEKV